MTAVAFFGAVLGGAIFFAVLSVVAAASHEDDLRDELHDRLEAIRWRRERER